MIIDERNIILQAIAEYGVDAQTDMMIEEMSELTKALCKYRRKESDETLDNIIEEMADVQIMLDQMMEIYDRDGKFEKYRDTKLIRLAAKLGIAEAGSEAAKGGLAPAT